MHRGLNREVSSNDDNDLQLLIISGYDHSSRSLDRDFGKERNISGNISAERWNTSPKTVVCVANYPDSTVFDKIEEMYSYTYQLRSKRWSTAATLLRDLQQGNSSSSNNFFGQLLRWITASGPVDLRWGVSWDPATPSFGRSSLSPCRHFNVTTVCRDFGVQELRWAGSSMWRQMCFTAAGTGASMRQSAWTWNEEQVCKHNESKLVSTNKWARSWDFWEKNEMSEGEHRSIILWCSGLSVLEEVGGRGRIQRSNSLPLQLLILPLPPAASSATLPRSDCFQGFAVGVSSVSAGAREGFCRIHINFGATLFEQRFSKFTHKCFIYVTNYLSRQSIIHKYLFQKLLNQSWNCHNCGCRYKSSHLS